MRFFLIFLWENGEEIRRIVLFGRATNHNDFMLLAYQCCFEFEDKKGLLLDKNVGFIVLLLLLSNETSMY